MIWPALMAFARPWQAAPAAHRLVCCVLACVTLSSCAGGAPAPSVRPARASLTRFTTSVTELRQRMEERPSCVLEGRSGLLAHGPVRAPAPVHGRLVRPASP